MARVFVTGSADGLGRMAAQLLVDGGHTVVLHARDATRARDAQQGVRGAADVIVGDLSSIEATKAIAARANELGAFDAVIHNAAVGYRERARIETVDHLPHLFAINSLAPYILTALMHKPKRLVYLSSGMHRGGDATLRDLEWKRRAWDGSQAYSDSKLHDTILAMAVARRWPTVLSNAVDPGWVPTKMGGRSAPDDLGLAPETQAWLAVSDDPAAMVSGEYFYHKRAHDVHPLARDAKVQDALIAACERFSGVPFPA